VRVETRVIANSLLSYLSQAVVAIVGILMVPYLLSQLGEARYGIIGIVTSFFSFAALIDVGISAALVRQFSWFLFRGEHERSNEAASTTMALYLLLATVILLATAVAGRPFLVAMQVSSGELAEALATLIIVAISLGVSLSTIPYDAALVSQLRHDVKHYTDMARAPFRALIVVVCFSIWDPRLVVWALAVLLAAIFTMTIRGWSAHRICPSLRIRRGFVSRRGMRDIAAFSVYTWVTQISAWVSLGSGALIVGPFLGTAAVAHFTPAVVLAGALLPLPRAFLVQLWPVVTRAYTAGDGGKVQRILVRSTRYSLLVGGGASAFVGSLAFVFIPVWLGAGFRDTSVVLVLACASILLQAAAGGAYSVFVGSGRLRGVALFDGIAAILNVVVSLYCVGWRDLGIAGAAIGMLVAQIVRTGGWIFYSARISGIGFGRYARESYLGPVVCLGVLTLTSVGVQWILDASAIVELAIAGGLSLLVFAASTWAIGLNEEDRDKAMAYAQRGWSSVSSVLKRLLSRSSD